MLSFAPFELLTIALGSLTSLAVAQDAALSSTNAKAGLQFTNAFTANLTLGENLAPIPIDGGLRIIRTITGGTLDGPLLKAKISNGFAADAFYDSGNRQRPTVFIYGTTDDGASFYIRESGVGNLQSWLTRLEIEIGGKYAAIKDQFIVAKNDADKTKSQIVVPVYKVTGSGCC